MFSHHDAFAIAKQRQYDFEADATARRLAKKSKEVSAKPERRRLRLFARPRPA